MSKYTGNGFKPLVSKLECDGVDTVYLNKNGKLKPYKLNAANIKKYLNEQGIFNGALPDFAYSDGYDLEDPVVLDGPWFRLESPVIRNYEGEVHKVRESFSTTDLGAKSLAERILRENRKNGMV